jgi:hypothetical protein
VFKRLVKAAQLRMAFAFVGGPLAGTVLAIPIMDMLAAPWAGLLGFGLAFVAMPATLSAFATVLLCPLVAACPVCGGSLWPCGSGSFKPRRVTVRPEVSACPHCHSPIR